MKASAGGGRALIRRTYLFVAVLILLILLGLAYQNASTLSSYLSKGVAPTTSQSTTQAQASATTTNGQPLSSGGLPPGDPDILGGSANIDYPPDYSALANYTLGLINADRAAANVSAVSLSPVPSGQQHADSMAYYGTIGHWDVQGYKPYMRYTLLGGTGYVQENVALNYCTDSPPSATKVSTQPCSVQTVENGIAASEYFFMNYDEACCNNGHRTNILDPMHNRVSIGIAYNSTTRAVYLVEDFEDSYITNVSLQLSGSLVTLAGSTPENLTGWTSKSSGASVVVYYDPTPTTIPTSYLLAMSACDLYSELSEPAQCEYQGSYGPGAQVADILAPCPPQYVCGSGNFTFAQTWQLTSGSFDITFSLSGLESTYGNGVYTLYLWPAGDTAEPITSLSVFVTGQ